MTFSQEALGSVLGEIPDAEPKVLGKVSLLIGVSQVLKIDERMKTINSNWLRWFRGEDCDGFFYSCRL